MKAVAGVLTVILMTAGCLSVKAYVDPQLPKVTYTDLLVRHDPRPLVLMVEFHRNGKPATLGASTAREAARAVVENSRLFSSLLDEPSGDIDRLEIVLDNVADLGEAAGRGAATGATFGAQGSQVTDGYIFTATFRPVGKQAVTKVYRHAIHSTVGNVEGPPGLLPEESVRAAFNKVVEGLVLNLLLDLQKEERLT
jgi:hypothetical protein